MCTGANLREIDHLEAFCINWRIILKCIFKKWDGVAETDLAQDGDRW